MCEPINMRNILYRDKSWPGHDNQSIPESLPYCKTNSTNIVSDPGNAKNSKY